MCDVFTCIYKHLLIKSENVMNIYPISCLFNILSINATRQDCKLRILILVIAWYGISIIFAVVSKESGRTNITRIELRNYFSEARNCSHCRFQPWEKKCNEPCSKELISLQKVYSWTLWRVCELILCCILWCR